MGLQIPFTWRMSPFFYGFVVAITAVFYNLVVQFRPLIVGP
jgi:hypothetical protein